MSGSSDHPEQEDLGGEDRSEQDPLTEAAEAYTEAVEGLDPDDTSDDSERSTGDCGPLSKPRSRWDRGAA